MVGLDRDAMKRVRPPQELFALLQEQVSLLQMFCRQFDAGEVVAAKPMAAALRTLLYHPDKPKAMQGSLLAQLGLRGGFWLDSTRMVGAPIVKADMTSWPQLFMVKLIAPEAGPMPKILAPKVQLRKTPFLEWWETSLSNNQNYGSISRRKLVLAMADQDGGAHVDGRVDELYDAFSDGRYVNMDFGNGPVRLQGLAQASIRTIAHETLLTLSSHMPKALRSAYSWQADGDGMFAVGGES